jgi:hypothetical protein
MVQPVSLEDRVVRHIDVERIAHEADVVVDNAGAFGVVELYAIAALREL